MLRDHTSASQLSSYARCPRQYRYKYIDGLEPERKSIALAVGTAVHAAIGWHFEMRIAGMPVDRVEVLRVLGAELNALLSDEKLDWRDAAPAEVHAEAERLVETFLDEYGGLYVVGIEEQILIEAPELPRPLLGYLDLVLENGTIVELKTAARRYSEADTATNLQFAAYRVAAQHLGRPGLRVMAILKTKKPQVQVLELPAASVEDERWFFEAAKDIEEAIAAGVFPPSPGMACSTCDYRGACREKEVRHAEAA